MTEIEKNKILMLRANGKTYADISKIMGINRNTISSFLRRCNDEIKPVDTGSDSFCKQCGKPIVQVPHRKEKKFCSDVCRMKWWKNHPEMLQVKSIKICKFCGKEFHPKRKSQILCSKSCAAKERHHER